LGVNASGVFAHFHDGGVILELAVRGEDDVIADLTLCINS
jgi:hypothetical protein